MGAFDDIIAAPAARPASGGLFDDIVPPPRSPLAEIGTAAKRGFYEGVQGTGEILQAPSEMAGQQPGVLSRVGQAMAKWAGAGVAANQPQAESHGAVTNFLSQAAAAPGQSLPVLAGAVGGSVAGTAVGGPVGGVVGGAAGGGSAAALQAWHEKYQEGLAKGLQDADARDYANQSAALQGAGMAAMSAIPFAGPVAGKVIGTAAKSAAEAGAEVVGKKFLPQFAKQAGKKFLPQFAKQAAEIGVANTGIGVGTAAGQAAIDQNAGLGGPTPGEAATAAIVPSVAGAVGFLPLAALHANSTARQATATQKALADPTADVKSRIVALAQVRKAMAAVDPEGAAQWAQNAATAIRNGLPVGMDDSWATTPNHPDASPPAPEPLPALPAPQPIAAGQGEPPAPDTSADENAAAVYAARDAEGARQAALQQPPAPPAGLLPAPVPAIGPDAGPLPLVQQHARNNAADAAAAVYAARDAEEARQAALRPVTAALNAPDAGPLSRMAAQAVDSGLAPDPDAPTSTRFPFLTQEAAQRQAETKSAQTGESYEAVPHPTIPNRFAIAPTVEEAPAEGEESAPPVTPDESFAHAEAMRPEIGWGEVGGRIIRDATTGDVVGRTQWIPKSDFWQNRPDKILSDRAAHTALDKAGAGQPLKPIEQRFVDYAEQTSRERTNQQAQEDAEAKGEQDRADAEAKAEADAEREAIQSEPEYNALSSDERDALHGLLDDSRGMTDAETEAWLEGKDVAGSAAAGESGAREERAAQGAPEEGGNTRAQPAVSAPEASKSAPREEPAERAPASGSDVGAAATPDERQTEGVAGASAGEVAPEPVAPKPRPTKPAPGTEEAEKREPVEASNPAAKPQRLYVERGGRRFEVGSLEEAAQKWETFRNHTGAGASEIGEGARIVDQDGNDVGRISYNGKVWPPGEWKPGMKPLVGDNFKPSTAKPEPLALTGQSNTEILTDEARRNAAQQQAAAKDNAPSPEGFTLSGSNRAADEGAARGQQDLLGAKGPEPKTSAFAEYQEATRKYRAREIGDDEYLAARRKWEADQHAFDEARGEAPPSKQIAEAAAAIKPAEPTAKIEDVPKGEPTTQIADFGEKIGGARKDTAAPLGKRPLITKAEDTRPMWARKYVAMQRIDPATRKPFGTWSLHIADRNGRASRVSRTEFPTEAEALATIPLAEVARNHRVRMEKDGKWGIYRTIGDNKRALVKGEFASEADAMKYMAANPGEIIEHKFAFPEKPWLDRIERIGPSKRKGNVSTRQFQDEFGFRAGEFGNWNMGSDGQAALNHAYDALHDLADTLGIPPKALSLNGELAIAFGARGHGGKDSARAHYEPGRVVINLTKIKGAGSLAHEWFHALDDYLTRSTDTAQAERARKVLMEGGRPYATHGFPYSTTARPELVKAFKALVDTMTAKRDGVAVDENVANRGLTRAQESLKQRLDALRQTIATERRYGAKKGAATAEQLRTWDALATRALAGDRGADVHIEGTSRRSFGYTSSEVVRALNDVFKSVTGSSFDRADETSEGRRLHWAIRSVKDMNDRVAKAQSGTIEERKRGTEFLDEAKKIDSYRASDYWSTAHEMGARAFESYIFDKLASGEKRSDYLTHGVENKFYALLGMKPYPEGEERTKINAAFDHLFQTIESKPTDKGTALFAKRLADSATDLDTRLHAYVNLGSTASDLLSTIAKQSDVPFNRELASRLIALGVNPEVKGGPGPENALRGERGFAAGSYDRATNTISLFTAKNAERHLLHEFVHAATAAAIDKGTLAGKQMKSLYEAVREQLPKGTYGATSVHEFTAEAFANPKFQALLDGIKSTQGKSAWQRFVETVRRILGLPVEHETALDDALRIGAQVMEENRAAREVAQNAPLFSREATADELDETAEPKGRPGGAPLYSGVKVAEFPKSGALASLQKIFAPASRGPIAALQAGIMRENFAKQARESESANEAMRAYAKAFSKMSKDDAIKFVNAYERGLEVDPKLRDVATAMRAFNGDLARQVQALGNGKLESFNENYLGRIWLDPQKKVNSVFARRPLEGSKGFLKRRVYQYFSQGLDAGLKPITYNPVEMMLLKGQEIRRYVYGQKIFAEMKAAGLVRQVAYGERGPDGWTAINDKIASSPQGRYYAPDEAATLFNNHLAPGLQGNGAYDAIHKAGMMLNSAQLGLSLFHLGFTTVDSMVSKAALGIQQLSRGQFLSGIGNLASSINPATPFINAYKGDRLLRAYLGKLNDPSLAPIVEAIVHGGGRVRMDEFYRNSTLNAFKQAIVRNDKLGAAKAFLPTVIDRINAPVFEQLVPRQKLGVFFDMAKDWLERNPNATLSEKREAMGKFWDSVDNRMGQLAYDNVFWNRTLKDALMISVRSVGWNLGTFRELGGGVLDTRGILRDRELSSRTAYLLALPFVTAVLGSAIGYMYTGQGPQELKDYFFPKTGRKRPDLSDDRVSLPSYMKDIFEYGHDISGFLKYGANPTNTLQNKLHPLLGMIVQMVSNKDFFGGAIRSPGDPVIQQLMDEAEYLEKQIVPFGIRNYQQQAKERGESPNLADYVTSPSFVGVSPSPAYITKSDQQTEASALGAQKDALMTKFREELQNGADPGEMSKRMFAAGLRLPEVHMVLKEGLSPVRVSKLPPRRLLPQVAQQ